MAFKGLSRSSSPAPSQSAPEAPASGIIVSPTKGDGRGNDLHSAATGQFVEKTGGEQKQVDLTNVSNFFKRMKEVYKAPTMKNFVLNRQHKIGEIKSVTAEQAKNAEAMRPYMKQILDNSNFTICIQFTHFLSFLQDGRYKNQFETRKSHGYIGDYYVRFDSSRKMFGHDLTNIELGKDLEKYGCIQAKNIKSYLGEKSGAAYGGYSASGYSGDDGLHCTMILRKRNLEDRTTYCLGDSLNTGVYPQKETLPFDIYASYYKDRFDNLEEITSLFQECLNKPCKIGGKLGRGNFIETQYHGDVTDKDVSKLVIGGRIAFNGLSDDKKKELLGGCSARGIKVLINNGHDDGLEEAKLDSDGNIYYTTYESEEIDDD